MKYVDEFRNRAIAQSLSARIAKEAFSHITYRLMEFCGGHTHTIHRCGIVDLLPSNVALVHGPGCPVCVLPLSSIDQAIALALQPNVIFCSYGDMLRVPGRDRISLLKAKGYGANVQMVYSVDDALRIAQENEEKKVIFFAIGFETTTPPTAFAIQKAQALKLKNFFVYCNHVLTPPALNAILQMQRGENHLHGFIGPAHVSVVIGTKPYEEISHQYRKPIVITGFEPLDVLQSVLMLIRQINEKRYGIENQYSRAVNELGNVKSQLLMQSVFAVRDTFEWRGLGEISYSALKIKNEYRDFDVATHFELLPTETSDLEQCQCGEILQGIKKPFECPLFGKVCHPENPMGACMVSSEGACAAYYLYRRHYYES